MPINGYEDTATVQQAFLDEAMEEIARVRAAIESEDVTELLAKINQENGDE